MSLRFILGRVGSGKSHHCLTAVRDALRVDPVEGPRLILLVPEQAALQTERALLDAPLIRSSSSAGGNSGPILAAHRAEVLSFRRLAFRVMDGSALAAREALSEPARAMVLRRLLAESASRLNYYGRSVLSARRGGRMTGVVQSIASCVSELLAEGIGPDELLRMTDEIERGAGHINDAISPDPSQRSKFRDIALIYQSYVDYLGSTRLDPSQYLEPVRDALPGSGWLAGAHVWVDGFASFGGQELLTLIALARRCECVDVSMLMDPAVLRDDPVKGEGEADPDDREWILAALRLFSRTHATYLELTRRFEQAGIDVEPPIFLDEKPRPRFARSRELTMLERGFAISSNRPVDGHSESSGGSSDVEIAELPTRRLEVEYAVARLRAWVRRDGYRYRDIAIIVRDLSLYHDMLRHTLEERNIPCFIDQRRSISHHPLVELLRGLIQCVSERLSVSSVQTLLKSGLVPISPENADRLENHLLAHDVAGLDSWRRDWTQYSRQRLLDDRADREPSAHREAHLDAVNTARRTMLRTLEEWLDPGGTDSSRTGAEWVEALAHVFSKLDVSASLTRWVRNAEDSGALDEAEEHRQVWRDVTALLDDLLEALPDVRMTAAELGDVLESGLANLTLGLAPPTADQVLVGAIERSRQPNIRAAILLGFNEGQYPSEVREDAVLNDDDRRVLRGVGARVGAAARDRVLDESLLAYIALTRASERLLITFAVRADDGAELRPSPYLDSMEAAVPTIKRRRVEDPAVSRKLWDVQSAADIAGRLPMELRGRPALGMDDVERRAEWNAVYEYARARREQWPAVVEAMRSLLPPWDEPLDSNTVQEMFGGRLRTSVSRLETFASCPFKHFGQHVLALRERETSALAALDLGLVHHAVLEDFMTALPDGGAFASLSPAQLDERLSQSMDRVTGRLPMEGELGRARNAYLLRRAASELSKAIVAHQRVSKMASFKPKAAELSFGMGDEEGLPAFALDTPKGRRVLLRGYIDRVDVAEGMDEALGVVMDYKRTASARQLDLSHVYHGLSLQLVAYLLVLAEHGKTLTGRPMRPIGAFYLNLPLKYVAVDHPDDVSDRRRDMSDAFRPRGLLDFSEMDHFEPLPPAGRATCFSAYRKVNGQPGLLDSTDAASSEGFGGVLQGVRLRLGELCDRILDGDVRVAPYRLGTLSPCSWCPYGSVCRYEAGVSETRFLDRMRRSEVFDRFAEDLSKARLSSSGGP